MKIRRILVLLHLTFVFFTCSISVFAQNRLAYRVFHKNLDVTDKVGIGIGNTRIPKGFNTNFNPNLNFNYSKKFTQRMDFRMDISYGFISSPSSIDSLILIYMDIKNLVKEYNGNIFSVQLMPQYSLFPAYHFSDRSKLNLYGGIGVGYLTVSRNEILGGQKSPENLIESFSNTKNRSIYIPTLIGLSYRLGDYFELALENQINFTFSNNLDGINVPEIRNKRDNFHNLNLVIRTYFSLRRKIPYIG
jgi:hypothetical protein